MSYQPYSPQTPPRRFERSRTDRFLGGVCGGAAEYLNMDATLVRVLTVLLSLIFPVTIVVYVVLLFVLPEAAPTPPPASPQVKSADPVWGAQGAPWEQTQPQDPAARN